VTAAGCASHADSAQCSPPAASSRASRAGQWLGCSRCRGAERDTSGQQHAGRVRTRNQVQQPQRICDAASVEKMCSRVKEHLTLNARHTLISWPADVGMHEQEFWKQVGHTTQFTDHNINIQSPLHGQCTLRCSATVRPAHLFQQLAVHHGHLVHQQRISPLEALLELGPAPEALSQLDLGLGEV
jgi:hypothetical protein